jgi:glycosyltransferase involved in cell wall biosynthesis
VWTDIETLYAGLAAAMERDRRIHFLSVGAGVKIAGNTSYERFEARVAASPWRDRFHLLGWRPASEVPSHYCRAHVGVNLDARHYETELGTRTRLVEMMRHGLPVVSSLGCELSDIVERQGLGLTFPIGDARAFSDGLVRLAQDEPARRVMAERAANYAADELSFQTTTRPVREWAQRPYAAPDRPPARALAGPGQAKLWARYWLRRWLWDWWALEPGE